MQQATLLELKQGISRFCLELELRLPEIRCRGERSPIGEFQAAAASPGIILEHGDIPILATGTYGYPGLQKANAIECFSVFNNLLINSLPGRSIR